jgi:hypothetical protein
MMSAIPRLEADQHRFRNEVRDEAQPQEPKPRMAPTRRVSVAEAFIKGAGSPAVTIWPSSAATRMSNVVVVLTLERPRRSDHCLDHHQQQYRVESYLHRQPGDRSIGHRLRNDDRGRLSSQRLGRVLTSPSGNQKSQSNIGALALAVSWHSVLLPRAFFNPSFDCCHCLSS